MRGVAIKPFARTLQAPEKVTAEWQSGYAAACKAVDLGSIPGSASNPFLLKIKFPIAHGCRYNAGRLKIPARVAKLVDARDLNF